MTEENTQPQTQGDDLIETGAIAIAAVPNWLARGDIETTCKDIAKSAIQTIRQRDAQAVVKGIDKESIEDIESRTEPPANWKEIIVGQQEEISGLKNEYDFLLHDIGTYTETNKDALKEIREALEFYAHKGCWGEHSPDDLPQPYMTPDGQANETMSRTKLSPYGKRDKGNKAKQALSTLDKIMEGL